MKYISVIILTFLTCVSMTAQTRSSVSSNSVGKSFSGSASILQEKHDVQRSRVALQILTIKTRVLNI